MPLLELDYTIYTFLKPPRDNLRQLLVIIFYGKLFQVKTCLKNHHTKLSYIEPRQNVVLKSNFFDSKVTLSHCLILFQRERKSFLRTSTMQRNEKKISETKLKGFLCL